MSSEGILTRDDLGSLRKTNVLPSQLNYDHYSTHQYDDEIIRVIPGWEAMHAEIEQIFQNELQSQTPLHLLELGVGSGLTAERILKIVPHSIYTAVDFSHTMLEGARLRLAPYSVTYIEGDYAQIPLLQNQDVVVSVIGIHHQENDHAKITLFQRIYDCLNPRGVFIFGDLVTYREPGVAALNEAKHFHYLVEYATHEHSLREWAYHHKYLNKLAPLENQVAWLREVGFGTVHVVYRKFNTALIYAKKL